MCGIAGIYQFEQQVIDKNLLTKMASLQGHRGPDDEGFYCNDSIGLAFRRLAILDLSSAGHQPMVSVDGSCAIIFNGEIYNHDVLRNELKLYGYAFQSSSDTEVILAAYQHWGVECLHRFNGMWGFALWDSRKQHLFCARDRVGVKPFYYHQNADRFLFASEIKALFADEATPRTPDEQSIYQYLLYGYVHFGQATFFQGIKQLPAAHYMLVYAHGVHLQQYWKLNHNAYNPTIRDSEAIEGFRHLFFDSVRLRLQSDVPVGTCLSGGLDSSAIVCVANQILFGKNKPERTVITEKQKTFSACYDDKSVDERQWITSVVDKTGAQPFQIFPDADGLFAELKTLIWHQDEPVAGSSIYAQWCVMRRAREAGIVVMLDGQGGDEVMGGYQRYYWAYMAGLLRSGRWKTFIQTSLQPWGTNSAPSRGDWLGLAYAGLPSGLQDRVNLNQKQSQAHSWLGDNFRQRYGYKQGYSQHPTWLGQALERDLTSDCLPSLLKYEDRNSMAHSIEARVPFLDYRLIEFMASLPDHMKIRQGQTKWLLRQALQDVLPPEVYQRRNKLGFATPEQSWLQQRWNNVFHILQGGALARSGWVRPQVISTLGENSAPPIRGEHTIWRWLNLEIWLQCYFHHS